MSTSRGNAMVRRCSQCEAFFTTTSPTRWWCAKHKPAPREPGRMPTCCDLGQCVESQKPKRRRKPRKPTHIYARPLWGGMEYSERMRKEKDRHG